MPVEQYKARIAEMKAVLQTEYKLQVDEDTLHRILEDKVDPREIIKNRQDQLRQDEFLGCFNSSQNLETMAKNGISKELMEWILVSQGVLTPQSSDELDFANVDIDRDQSENYIKGFVAIPKHL